MTATHAEIQTPPGPRSPRRLGCVVVCVGRADALARTLEHNATVVDEIIVVTATADRATQQIVQASRGTLVVSDRCYDDDHAFNKGRMMNDGLTRIAAPDWLIFTDADVLLNADLRMVLNTFPLDPDSLYGTNRFDVQPQQLASFLTGELSFTGQPSMGGNAEPNGYFQLFNRHARAIADRWPAIVCEGFCSAGGVDSWFKEQWPTTQRVQLPQIAVAHLAHGRMDGHGWNGARRGGWRQWGMLRARGFFPIEEAPIVRPMRLRLTDTLRGETHEIEIDATNELPPEVVCSNGAGGLRFLGKDIADQLIHVAYFAAN